MFLPFTPRKQLTTPSSGERISGYCRDAFIISYRAIIFRDFSQKKPAEIKLFKVSLKLVFDDTY